MHFFDLCNWFIGAEPAMLSAAMAGETTLANADCGVGPSYGDGSIAQVLYSTLGHGGPGKEYYEALEKCKAARCSDLCRVRIYGAHSSIGWSLRPDRGHFGSLD